MENKLIKLPTPHGEMELLWLQELYQGFIPEQHGGTLLYNGEKYFTTLKSISELESIVSPDKVSPIITNISIDGSKKYIRELGDHLVYCQHSQSPVSIGKDWDFVITSIMYDLEGGAFKDEGKLNVVGFLV